MKIDDYGTELFFSNGTKYSNVLDAYGGSIWRGVHYVDNGVDKSKLYFWLKREIPSEIVLFEDRKLLVK